MERQQNNIFIKNGKTTKTIKKDEENVIKKMMNNLSIELKRKGSSSFAVKAIHIKRQKEKFSYYIKFYKSVLSIDGDQRGIFEHLYELVISLGYIMKE